MYQVAKHVRRWNKVPGFYGLYTLWGFPPILRMFFMWIIVNMITVEMGSHPYFLADVRTWRLDVRSEWGLSNFLKNMILRIFLNIYTSHRFRPLFLSFVVSQRESSFVKEGHVTKDSEHVGICTIFPLAYIIGWITDYLIAFVRRPATHCWVNCRFFFHRKRSFLGETSYLRKILNIFTKKSEHFTISI